MAIKLRFTAAITLGCMLCTMWINCKPLVEGANTRGEISEALGEYRVSEGRISGVSRYLPYAFGSSVDLPGDENIRNLYYKIYRGKTENLSPNDLSDLAILELVLGRGDFGKLGKAERAIEVAISKSKPNAVLYSDLAVIRLKMGELNSYQYIKAVSAAKRAVELDPLLPEAWFNLAVALKNLNLKNSERSAWESYLNLDEGSDWAKEARRRIGELGKKGQDWEDKLKSLTRNDNEVLISKIVSTVPQFAREYAENELLAQWAEQIKAGKYEDAKRTLKVIERIGIELLVHSGDQLLTDVVSCIDDLLRSPLDAEELILLAEAHRYYGLGRSHYAQFDVEVAAYFFEKARTGFRQLGSPMEKWSLFYLAVCDYHRSNFGNLTRILNDLRAELVSGKWPNLLGRVLWLTGLTKLTMGFPTEALSLYASALSQFDRTNERGNKASVYNLMAENYRVLGNHGKAWECSFKSLEYAPYLVDSKRKEGIYEEAAENLAKQGELAVAVLFQGEVVLLALQSRNPIAIADALLTRAAIYKNLHNVDKALADIRLAREQERQVSDISVKESLMVEIALTEALVRSSVDPWRSLNLLNQVESSYALENRSPRLFELYSEKAKVKVRLGLSREAEEDFVDAITILEEQRKNVSEDHLRLSFFDDSIEVYKRMVLLQIRNNRPDLAFEYAERIRARTILDKVGKSDGSLSLGELQAQIPDGTALIQYLCVENKLIAWMITREDFRFWIKEISEDSLLRKVSEFYEAVRKESAPSQRKVLAELHGILVDPFFPSLQIYESLTIVPDGILCLVPFSALVDAKTGKYLLESANVSISPSSSLPFVFRRHKEKFYSEERDTVLVFGDPAFDSKVLPDLPRLPGAVVEAQEVGKIYHKATVLLGNKATKEQFLALASRSRIIHFAGHASINPEYPLLSQLLFAKSHPEGGRSGILYSHELEGLDLRKTSLVILSACSAGSGALSPSEGPLSLVRSFWSASVPGVVASLWNAEDKAARHLLVEFHKELSGGLDPAAALRSAQVSMVEASDESTRSPAAWAGFQYYGSSSGTFSNKIGG